jgi:hypothetical protein
MEILFEGETHRETSFSCFVIDAQSGETIGSAEGYLSRYGDLVTVIKIHEPFQGRGLGFQAFNKVFSELSLKGTVKRLIGGWHKGDEFSYCEEGMSTNLRLFKESIDKGIDPISSAWNTPTGKWVKKKGFTNCTINLHSSESAEVIFY